MIPKCTIHLTEQDIMKIIKAHFNLEPTASFIFHGLVTPVQVGDTPVEVIGVTAEVKTEFTVKPAASVFNNSK